MTELALNLEIYSPENIAKAISAYCDYADIMIVEKTNLMILQFDNCKFDSSITIKEFECYLIGLENS